MMVLTCGALALLGSQSQAAQKLSLSWNPSADTNGVTYNVYYGTSSKSYSQKQNTGVSTSATISGLQEGSTYYFVVTSVNMAGLESPPSNQISFSVSPVSLAMSMNYQNGIPVSGRITTLGSPPTQWTLQQSSDLMTWQTVCSGTNCPVDVTVDATIAPVSFFRLLNL